MNSSDTTTGNNTHADKEEGALKNAGVDSSCVVTEVQTWLQDVVIGLGLCPFAGKPSAEGSVHFAQSEAVDEEGLLAELKLELERLDSDSRIETTLLILPTMMADFYEYNNFLDWVDGLLVRHNWEGVYQVASFHPDYCFAGAHPDDAENLTNRSPYPILHIIREASLEAALAHYPNADQIPDNNIDTVEALTAEQTRALFPYLFK